MRRQVRWSLEAVSTFEQTISYLENYWSQKEVDHFIDATDRVIHFISENPKLFRGTNLKGVREALITPQNLLIYKIYPNHIDLISFWDTRRNPRLKPKTK